MSVSVAPDGLSGWTVAADHFLCRYDLFGLSAAPNVSILSRDAAQDTALTLVCSPAQAPTPPRLQRLETTAAGRSEVHVRDDNRLVAVAGWDGESVNIHYLGGMGHMLTLAYSPPSLLHASTGRAYTRRKLGTHSPFCRTTASRSTPSPSRPSCPETFTMTATPTIAATRTAIARKKGLRRPRRARRGGRGLRWAVRTSA